MPAAIGRGTKLLDDHAGQVRPGHQFSRRRGGLRRRSFAPLETGLLQEPGEIFGNSAAGSGVAFSGKTGSRLIRQQIDVDCPQPLCLGVNAPDAEARPND